MAEPSGRSEVRRPFPAESGKLFHPRTIPPHLTPQDSPEHTRKEETSPAQRPNLANGFLSVYDGSQEETTPETDYRVQCPGIRRDPYNRLAEGHRRAKEMKKALLVLLLMLPMNSFAGDTPLPQKTAKLLIKIKAGTQLWYFGGAPTPAQFTAGDTQITLTAFGANTGTFEWDITAGADKVYLENNQTSVTKTNDNTLLVTSIAPSAMLGDVSIRLTYGTQAATKKLSVREPYTFEALGHADYGRNNCSDISTQADLGTTGYVSFIAYNILNQFDELVMAAGATETLGAKTDLQPNNNWNPGTAYSVLAAAGTFADAICVPAVNGSGIPLNPTPQAPSTLADVNPIDKTPQTWTIGVSGLGLGGVAVQSDNIYRYIDHARHKDIVTPLTP